MILWLRILPSTGRQMKLRPLRQVSGSLWTVFKDFVEDVNMIIVACHTHVSFTVCQILLSLGLWLWCDVSSEGLDPFVCKWGLMTTWELKLSYHFAKILAGLKLVAGRVGLERDVGSPDVQWWWTKLAAEVANSKHVVRALLILFMVTTVNVQCGKLKSTAFQIF